MGSILQKTSRATNSGDLPGDYEWVNCPGCGSAETTIVRRGRDWYLERVNEICVVRCKSCGLHYTNPRPAPEVLGDYYPQTYACHVSRGDETKRGGVVGLAQRLAYGSPTVRPRGLSGFIAHLALLLRDAEHYGAGLPFTGQGRLLDFGCGEGKFLRRMAALGWDGTGVDFARKAVDSVRSAGLKAHVGSLPNDHLPPEQFDAVTMIHSLEHVPNPTDVLTGARDVLVPGGRLMIVVPNFNGWDIEYFGDASMGLQLPLHLTHFTPETLARMVERCGFEVESIKQKFRPGWIKRALTRAAQRRGPRPGDWWLGWSLIRSAVGQLMQWRGKGNEIRLIARKP